MFIIVSHFVAPDHSFCYLEKTVTGDINSLPTKSIDSIREEGTQDDNNSVLFAA